MRVVNFLDSCQKDKGVTTCGPTLGHNLSLVPLTCQGPSEYETHYDFIKECVTRLSINEAFRRATGMRCSPEER
eukprot:COSAG03_NODE_159_length_11381_cov_85.480057_1_plen_74_part_00